jgi:hypothetical protein
MRAKVVTMRVNVVNGAYLKTLAGIKKFICAKD